MKNIYALSALFFTHFFSFALLNAQHYKPLHSDAVNLYAFPAVYQDSGVYLKEVFIDQIIPGTTDTLFYFNKIRNFGDTTQRLSVPNYMPAEYITGQDCHLGRGYIQKPDGSFRIFNSTGDTFFLETQLPIGQNWNFFLPLSVTASIIMRDTMEVLGRTDSVLHILLSNGRHIILSKNYGFVQFSSYMDYTSKPMHVLPSYKKYQQTQFDLYGWKKGNDSTGVSLLSLRQNLNMFEPGECIYRYYETVEEFSNSFIFTKIDSVIQYLEVLDRTPDSSTYRVNLVIRYNRYSQNHVYSYSSNTQLNITIKLPNQLLIPELPHNSWDDIFFEDLFSSHYHNRYSFIKCNTSYSVTPYGLSDTVFNGFLISDHPDFGGPLTIFYRAIQGIGFNNFNNFGLGYFNSSIKSYSKLNGDATLFPKCNYMYHTLNGEKDITPSISWYLYPNPVTQEVKLKPAKGEPLQKLNLYDTQGSLLWFGLPSEEADGYSLPSDITNTLSPGIYLLHLNFEVQTPQIIRFIKM